MTAADAEDGAEMPRARPEGSGRKPREHGMGVSNVTAGSVHSQPAAQMRLMELAVSRENMMDLVKFFGAPGDRQEVRGASPLR